MCGHAATLLPNLYPINLQAYSKTCHSKRRPKLVFKTDYRLMQVKSIAECSKGSILQYFQPSLSYHLSLRSLFCLCLNGRLRQVFTVCICNRIKQSGKWCGSIMLASPDLQFFKHAIYQGQKHGKSSCI